MEQRNFMGSWSLLQWTGQSSGQVSTSVSKCQDFDALIDYYSFGMGSNCSPRAPRVMRERPNEAPDHCEELILPRKKAGAAVRHRPAIGSPRSKAGVFDCGDETTWCPTLPPAVLTAS